MSEIVTTFERNFDTLLVDSVEFLLEAWKDPVREQTLARASILSALLMLETAANICIEHVSLEGTIQKEIDRLPILGKFDFYLRTRFRNKALERGVRQVEYVKELKRIRDGLVHLKTHRVEWERYCPDGVSTLPIKTKVLGVAENPKFWTSQDAVLVSQGVHDFLRYFFREKCRYTAPKVASVLFSEAEVPGDREGYTYPAFERQVQRRLQASGIDLSYIQIAWAA